MNAAKNYYYSFIYSTLTYGIAVWGGSLLSTQYQNKLTSIHNKIVKTLFAKHTNTYDVDSIHKDIKILKPTDIYKYHICLLLHGIIKHKKIPDIYDNLIDLCFRHSYQTRSAGHNLMIPFPHSHIIKCNFLFIAIKEWNSLPNALKEINEQLHFKRSLKKSILDSY